MESFENWNINQNHLNRLISPQQNWLRPFQYTFVFEFCRRTVKHRHQLDCYLFSMIRDLSLLELLYDCLLSVFRSVDAANTFCYCFFGVIVTYLDELACARFRDYPAHTYIYTHTCARARTFWQHARKFDIMTKTPLYLDGNEVNTIALRCVCKQWSKEDDSNWRRAYIKLEILNAYFHGWLLKHKTSFNRRHFLSVMPLVFAIIGSNQYIHSVWLMCHSIFNCVWAHA